MVEEILKIFCEINLAHIKKAPLYLKNKIYGVL